MKPIIDDINNIIYKIYRKKHPLLAELVRNWTKIIGLKYSSKSWPVNISNIWDKKQRINILFIGTDHSTISTEIRFQQGIILERMAIYLGYKAIHKIVVT